MAPARRPRPDAASDTVVEQDGSAEAREVYREAVVAAERLWHGAKTGNGPDPAVANGAIDALSGLVGRDRRSLLALASGDSGDPYTFTHMVNVAALTLALAADLHIDGPLLRAFGVAALLHDIGKVRTPDEILSKPEALTREEFDVIKRHAVDGAAILKRTPGISPLAVVVAFEHHLKQDLSGYPEHTGTRALNVCTQLVSIADVFDALRSDRPYRRGMSASRVRTIISEQQTGTFNHELLVRFVAVLEHPGGE